MCVVNDKMGQKQSGTRRGTSYLSTTKEFDFPIDSDGMAYEELVKDGKSPHKPGRASTVSSTDPPTPPPRASIIKGDAVKASPQPAPAVVSATVLENTTAEYRARLAGPDVGAFHRIPIMETLPDELPPFARSVRFNRYFDILPNPHTRVQLSVLDGQEETSYINANYIHGHICGETRPQCYIAAQAPTPDTLFAWTRMIYEKSITHVVMLTDNSDFAKKKCHQYIPRHTGPTHALQVGNFSVELLSKTKTRLGWVQSQVLITDIETSNAINVEHFWFTQWPDHDVPPAGSKPVESLLDMLLTVLSWRRRDKGASPLLVHCSAGVGRTGTYFAIDQALQALEHGRSCNLVDIIRDLRKDRMSLVQTAEQYKFALAVCQQYYYSGTGMLSSFLPNKTTCVDERTHTRVATEPAEQPDELLGADWFMPSPAIRASLVEQPVGSFYVRPSEVAPHCFSLSVVVRPGLVLSPLIVPATINDCTVYKLCLGQNTPDFISVVDLIAYFTTHSFTANVVTDHSHALSGGERTESTA